MEGSKDFCVGPWGGDATGEHDVATIGRATFGQRLKVLRPMMMVCPEVKALKRCRSARRWKSKAIVVPNSAIFGNSTDDRE